ncbi:MAG: prepilin-type N-terminal cleavage/methylation domain-containing protein [Verrucomicrobia bacterium]|jgi:prepilin-type N-terminal cleavage/methylation domain-containing protein|nr:prepilin-type N-terminal cleavage/methylation domain-containing protein [Verrucomicrobiota bacterium]
MKIWNERSFGEVHALGQGGRPSGETGTDGKARPEGAFTLIEVMVVVAILGVILAISIPAIHRAKDQAPLIQTVKEIQKVCSLARARAIFSGATAQVVFRPYERTFALAGGSLGESGFKAGQPSTTSGIIHENLAVEMLDVNLMEFKDQDLAVVNFYPNGTCDELTIVLRSDRNEWRKISLEATTGLATVGGVR